MSGQINNTRIDDDLLEKYKEQIISDLNLEKLPEEETKIIEDKLDQVITDRIINLILIYMPEDKVAEVDKMMESASPEEVIAFMLENVPGFADKIANELIDIRNELVKAMKK